MPPSCSVELSGTKKLAAAQDPIEPGAERVAIGVEVTELRELELQTHVGSSLGGVFGRLQRDECGTMQRCRELSCRSTLQGGRRDGDVYYR